MHTLALAAAVLMAGAVSLVPRGAAAQDDLDRACAIQSSPSDCALFAATARMVQPRVGAALWGGNPVPGTASTLGMRIGTTPRLSLAGRFNLVPAEVPPLLDRSRPAGERTLLVGLSADGAIGILGGFSPLPTVGGFLSLDLIARASYLFLPLDAGFHDDAAWGGSVGARIGLLRESFTLPGVSVTGAYRFSSSVAFGDPFTATDDGFFDAPITDLHLEAAVSKRLMLLGITGAVTLDRYLSDLQGAYSTIGGSRVPIEAKAETDRWGAYFNVAFTMLILHASAELGLQEVPVPEGMPSSISLDPVGWYAGLAFRLSI